MGDILFLAHRVPYPPDRGDKIRSFNILKRLCELGTVHLAAFADDEADLAHGEALRQVMGSRLGSLHIERRSVSRPVGATRAMLADKPMSLPLFDSAGIRRFVGQTLDTKPVSTVFAFSSQMAQFVPQLPPGTRFIMDFVDVDSEKFANYALKTSSAVMQFVYRREARKLGAHERAVAERADYSLFVSEAEAEVFRSKTGFRSARIRVLENGIDCDHFEPDGDFPIVDKPGAPLLVFTGQMDYRPNIDGAISFADDVLPGVREMRPDAHFAIVGRNPTPEVLRLAKRRDITVTGEVDDIRSWLHAADLVVAPLRVARGIQNKVLEAMAMAKPVIASSDAFEGIDAEPGRHIMVGDTPNAGVHMILDLLDNEAMANLIGQAARQRMLARYSWESALAPLAEMITMPRGEAAA
ncbi:TIGR03087 family PEP-CTERM/XrtA system glycosyltransferase [Parasphingopyxis marina]